MNSLKNYLSFLMPLIALLFAVEFSLMSSALVRDYEALMGKDYNIIIVSNKEVASADLRAKVPTFALIEPLSTKKIINRLSNEISAKNLATLESSLPKFYSIKLSAFPSPALMNEIKQGLQKIGGISRVETFSRTHNKVYKILNLIKSLSNMFMCILAIIGTMLMFKQLRIWLFEHRERIEIMALFGAPFWLKGSRLYKIAIIDSLIATIVVMGIFYILPNYEPVVALIKDIDLIIPNLDLAQDSLILLAISLSLSLISVYFVMRSSRR